MIGIKEQESLLTAISRKLDKKITVFAIGGNAMIFWGHKDSTVDVDLVFTGESDRREFIRALKSLGFELMDSCRVYGVRENQPIMLARTPEERFDLFLKEVISFTFSLDMQKRAERVYEFGGKLFLRVADFHDIILLKCATDREKDIEDIRNIIENAEVKWDILVREAENQIHLGNRRPVFFLLDTLSRLKKEMKIEIPEYVFKKIWNFFSLDNRGRLGRH